MDDYTLRPMTDADLEQARNLLGESRLLDRLQSHEGDASRNVGCFTLPDVSFLQFPPQSLQFQGSE